MPLLDLQPGDVTSQRQLPIAQFSVMAAMYFPNEDVERNSFFFSLAQDAVDNRARDDGMPLVLPHWFLMRRGKYVDAQAIIASADPVVIRGAKKTQGTKPSLSGSLVAGELLQLALKTDERSEEVSVGRCMTMLSEELTGCMGVSVRDLRSHWQKFRNVSPFWAAHIETRFCALCSDRISDFIRFLVLAEQYRTRGERILVRNYGPLLDPASTWKLPTHSWHDLVSSACCLRGSVGT